MAKKVTGDIGVGCDFDALTAQATHGKNIVLMVFDSEGTEPLGLAGQQGLTFTLEVENSETSTKDGTGDWTVRFPGVKSWNASTDGLWIDDDDARKEVVKAMINGTPLCVGMYAREAITNGVKYTPIRKGLALVSSDEIEAPNDDNTTYSVEFEGTGPCWCVEAADPSEVTSATITITDEPDAGGQEENEGLEG